MKSNDSIIDIKHLVLSIIFWTGIVMQMYENMKKNGGQKFEPYIPQ